MSAPLLDNLASVFTFESGHGRDPADGRAISAHPAQVFLTALRAIGSTQNSLGEVREEIPGLR